MTLEQRNNLLRLIECARDVCHLYREKVFSVSPLDLYLKLRESVGEAK